MSKFQPGDYITQINTGEEFVVMDVRSIIAPHTLYREEYSIMHLMNGGKYNIHLGTLDNYCLSKNYDSGGTYTARSTVNRNCQINLDDVELPIGFDEPAPTYDGCQHDWITWTGLHGTQTDCSKCKEVKKEV